MPTAGRKFVESVHLREGDGRSGYPFTIPALRHFESLRFHRPVSFLVGENGSGKSTLLEAIAVAARFNPEGGSRHFDFALRPTESELHEHLVIHSARNPKTGFFFRAESFFNVATQVDELKDPDILAVYGGKSLHEQSHGESFLALVMNRFGPNGLYILDEPEAALSFHGQLALLRRMHQLVGQGSQFIVATHSPVLMAFPGAEIWVFSEGGIESTEYEQTEHYQMMHSFFESRDRFFKHLFGE